MNFSADLPVVSNVRDFNQSAYTGTASEIVNKGLKINGVAVDAVALSILAKYNLVKTVGEEGKSTGKRGRRGKILAFVPGVEFVVSV